MNPALYLRALRRRWVDLVLAGAVGLAVGVAVPSVAPPGPPVRTYEATSVLLSTSDPFLSGYTNLKALAALAKVGEVPRRVAESTAFEGDPVVLAQMVETRANAEAGILEITVSSSDGQRAATLADAFANELVAFLGEQRASATSAQARALQEELDALEREIRVLDRSIPSAAGSQRSILEAQRAAKIGDYQLLYQTYQQVARGALDTGSLQLIQSATPIPVDVGGLQAPASRGGWVVLGAVLGLLSGAVLVLVLDRFDTRIRTRQDAERHFGLPVLAEIPFVPRWRREEGVITVARPKSPAADAYRILGATLAMPRPLSNARDAEGDGDGQVTVGGSVRAPRTILVTSPGPGDGKTSVVANLGVAVAGRGASVLIVSCDLRRPAVHRMFGVPNEGGLAEALRAEEGGPLLDGRVFETGVPGVRLVPSGVRRSQTAELLSTAAMARVIAQAGRKADVVLLDTPPILTTSDAAGILSKVDAVVVVARAGRTTAEVAERTSELLKRLGAPAIGVVLNAATEITVPSRYHYYRYYHAPVGAPRRRGFPRLARPSGKGKDLGW